jgi:DNA-binding MarR family transcriptional regulator
VSATPRRGGGFLLLDLHYASRLAGRLLEEELERRGVPAVWAGLLTEIRTIEPVRPTALAGRTGVAPATLYDHLEELVALGLVERRVDPGDRRAQLIVTTQAGRERVRDVSAAVRAEHRRLARRLDGSAAETTDAVTRLRFALERALNEDATH